MFERPSQRMSAAVGTDPSCIAQESPLLMCSLSLQTHIFQDSVSPRDLYSVRTAASLPPSAVLHTFQKWSQWVDLALRLWKSKRHFSCFWHEKDNVGHRTLLANFDHEQVPCVSGSQQTNASWSFFNNSSWNSVKSKCFPVGSAAIFLRLLHAFVFCIISLAMFFFFLDVSAFCLILAKILWSVSQYFLYQNFLIFLTFPG